MTSLFFGQLTTTGVPADEKIVRSTSDVVQVDAPPAMQDDMPTQSEVETDPNPLLGMTTRQMASKWTEGEQFVPEVQLDELARADDHNGIVDRQVSTAGTAASREASGQWGHGTASFAVGIEPVGDLRGGNVKFGNEYFERVSRGIQSGAGSYMSPAAGSADQNTKGSVAALGKDNARKAASAALYNTYWNGGAK
jgi:hypothetical protein